MEHDQKEFLTRTRAIEILIKFIIRNFERFSSLFRSDEWLYDNLRRLKIEQKIVIKKKMVTLQ